jgi:hypothetical protein
MKTLLTFCLLLVSLCADAAFYQYNRYSTNLDTTLIDGGKLTNLFGTNIVLATVNSNKFDAATLALFGVGGGSGTGIQTNGGTGTNNVLTGTLLLNTTNVTPMTFLTANGSPTAPLYITNESGIFHFGNVSGHAPISVSTVRGGGQFLTFTFVDAAGPMVTSNSLSMNLAYNGNALTNLNAANLTGGPITNAISNANVALRSVDFQILTNSTTQAPRFNYTNLTTYADFATNASFTFLAPLNVSPTNYQTAVVLVTNTLGTLIVATAPTGVHQLGTWNVTNVTVFSFFNDGGKWTNAIAMPVW